MARVSLGHTGRMLSATRLVAFAFVLVAVAGLVRVGAPFLPGAWYLNALIVSAGAWSCAFLTFIWGYAKILVGPRVASGGPHKLPIRP